MSRIITLLIVTIAFLVNCHAKSPEKDIKEAMEASDWFAVDSIYRATPEGSLSDFIDVYARCLIGNRLNRPEVSIPAFEQLFANHSKELDHIDIYALVFARDLSRVGDNAKAASMLSSIIENNSKKLDSSEINQLKKDIKRYESLSIYRPYTITFNDTAGCIPFRIVPAGNPKNKGVIMRIDDSQINGIKTNIIFDTGAGANVISDSLAERLNLLPIDVETKVAGFKPQVGSFAIAKEVKIGNIIVNDVPFFIMNITSNNAEADQYLKDLNIIMGSDLMLQLKDLTIDFGDNVITVPAVAPDKTATSPNLCFSSSMNLLAKGLIQDVPLLMNVDTGDTSYGTVGKKFYSRNKKLIKTNGITTTLRRAGIGDAKISEGFLLPDLILKLGGTAVELPQIEVQPKTDPFGYECNIGLKSLMLFKKVRFNLVDFVLSTQE